MEEFAKFYRNIKLGSVSVEAVKIAIIDDGIDASLPDLQDNIVAGKSFSPYPNTSEFWNAYFVPSGRHGTQMATLIRQIYPLCRLFVARLEERPGGDGTGRRITAQSAAKVMIL
jgi:hypothetical protein